MQHASLTSTITSRPRVAAMVLLVSVIGLAARGESLTLKEHSVTIPERGPVTAHIASFETNHFSFMAPPGWRVSSKPGSLAVVMIPADLATSISIHFLTSAGVREAGRSEMAVIMQRYPDATVGEGFPFHTGFGEAMGFDLQRKAANGVRMNSRVLYIFHPAATIELTLTSPTGEFLDHTARFSSVVSSFHAPSH